MNPYYGIAAASLLLLGVMWFVPGSASAAGDTSYPLPWGDRVSYAFRRRVYEIAHILGVHPYWLMAVMAFETRLTFRPDIYNDAGSGAVGLIQFLRSTARELGTTTDALAAMTAEMQLEYVLKYLRRYRGRMTSLEELYTAIYRPAALGLPLDAVLQLKGSDAYAMNRGLDSNFDGVITKREMSEAVMRLYRREMARFQARAAQLNRSIQ